MGRCDGCCFWDLESVTESHPGHGRCQRLEHSGQLWSDAWEKNGIFTASDFGCTLWEPTDKSRHARIPDNLEFLAPEGAGQ